jgi:hypothetical protein
MLDNRYVLLCADGEKPVVYLLGFYKITCTFARVFVMIGNQKEDRNEYKRSAEKIER